MINIIKYFFGKVQTDVKKGNNAVYVGLKAYYQWLPSGKPIDSDLYRR